MKKNLYIFFLLVFLVLPLAGCVKNQAAKDQKTAPGTDNVAPEAEEEEINASALEMMAKGRSLHCTFTSEDAKEGMKQTGDFYVDGANKKFRIEATAVMTGTQPLTLKTKTISDNVYLYFWNSLDEKAGFKMKMDQAAQAETNADKNTQDLNQDIKFRCRGWKVDNSMFELPSGVQFTDMEAMLKAVTSPKTGGTVDLCAICNQIPDATQKSQCLKTNCK
jgi:hypothetical protein